MHESLVVGIIAGLTSATLLAVFGFIVKVIWQNRVEPWWENKLYADARIDGEWCAELVAQRTASDTEVVTVKQTGHKISGEIACTGGPDEGKRYDFVGTFRNQILSGYYWNVRETSIDSGSFSLRLENDGMCLNGYTSYYHDPSHNIEAGEYKWLRRTN